MVSALSLAGSWIFGLVLGKILDFFANLAEELTKNNENQIKSMGVWLIALRIPPGQLEAFIKRVRGFS